MKIPLQQLARTFRRRLKFNCYPERPHTEHTEKHGAHGGRYKFPYIFIRFTQNFGGKREIYEAQLRVLRELCASV